VRPSCSPSPMPANFQVRAALALALVLQLLSFRHALWCVLVPEASLAAGDKLCARNMGGVRCSLCDMAHTKRQHDRRIMGQGLPQNVAQPYPLRSWTSHERHLS